MICAGTISSSTWVRGKYQYCRIWGFLFAIGPSRDPQPGLRAAGWGTGGAACAFSKWKPIIRCRQKRSQYPKAAFPSWEWRQRFGRRGCPVALDGDGYAEAFPAPLGLVKITSLGIETPQSCLCLLPCGVAKGQVWPLASVHPGCRGASCHRGQRHSGEG